MWDARGVSRTRRLLAGFGSRRGTRTSRAVVESLLFPVRYVYAPPVLGAYNGFRGGSVGGSLLRGAVPGPAFPLLAGVAMAVRTGPADSPAWVRYPRLKSWACFSGGPTASAI
jgi:hypothetical protein